MKSLVKNFRKELDKFWVWARQSPKEYEENRRNIYWEEWDYPNWNGLQNLAFDAVRQLKSGNNCNDLVKLILEFMAIDNEGEDTLDLCELELPNTELEYLIESSIQFHLSNTRWQIAELIGRKKNKKFEKYLLLFVNDNNKYVQRRALLSLAKTNSKKAEEVAMQKLNDEDDYLRLVSLKILREVCSKYLQKAVNILKDDKFNFIQLEIQDIKNKLHL